LLLAVPSTSPIATIIPTLIFSKRTLINAMLSPLSHFSLCVHSYPRAREFCAKKEQYAPAAMFDNGWFKRYCLNLCSYEYQRL